MDNQSYLTIAIAGYRVDAANTPTLGAAGSDASIKRLNPSLCGRPIAVFANKPNQGASGRAGTHIRDEARNLDPALSGIVALIQGTLSSKKDPQKAIRLFDEARLLSPGTLVEGGHREVGAQLLCYGLTGLHLPSISVAIPK